MSWFETLTEETFQAIVREALKDELKREIEAIKQRLDKIEDQVERVRDTQIHFADGVGRLEGTLEGTMRGIMADFKLEFYEKFRGALPERTESSKAANRKKLKKSLS
jgi:tetrahydromethanopterin S-methyltransferase subunit G